MLIDYYSLEVKDDRYRDLQGSATKENLLLQIGRDLKLLRYREGHLNFEVKAYHLSLAKRSKTLDSDP
jgi:hypothetical protein